VFISQREMQDLARFMYFNQIVPILLDYILEREGLDSFQRATAFRNHFATYLRRCLFIALSDGREDRLLPAAPRRPQPGAGGPVLPRASSENYLDELRRQQGPAATFSHVILIDDFAGSGYTLAHQRPGAPALVDGSLQRVYEPPRRCDRPGRQGPGVPLHQYRVCPPERHGARHASPALRREDGVDHRARAR